MGKRRSDGEGSIYKYDGGYRAVVTVGQKLDGTPIRKYVRAKTEKEARKKRDKLLEQAQSGFVSNLRLTVCSALDMWIEDEVDHAKANTERTYKWVIERFIRPTFGNRRLADLHDGDIRQFYRELRSFRTVRDARPYAKSNLVLVQKVTNAFLQYCKGDKLIATNPAAGLPLIRVDKNEVQTWDQDQFRRFLDVLCGHPYEAFFVTMATTGMRASEVRGLCWDSVDLQRGTILVRRTLVEPGGGVKGMVWQEFGKSESSRRSIPIVEPTLGLLRELQDSQQNARRQRIAPIGRASEPNELSDWEERGMVFLNSNGTPVSRTLANSTLKKLAQKAGVPLITQHQLRHMFATLLIQMNVSDLTLQRLLGHSSVGITKGVYGHVFDHHQREAITAFGELYLTGTGDRARPYDGASIDAAIDAG